MTQMSRSEWDRIAAALDGSVAYQNAQQQRLFRLFQALRSGNFEDAEKWLRDGAPLDLPLEFDEDRGGPPRAEQFRFPALDGLDSITALGYMAGQGDLDAVVWLLARGANVTAPFSHGRDAAWVAMEMNQPALVELLLAKGANPNLAPERLARRSRLIEATRLSNRDVVEILLQKKARVGLYDSQGRTALHHNFEKDPYAEVDVAIGRLLIDWGGNPAAVDLAGTAPADLAHDDVQYALLRQHGLEKKLQKVDVQPPPPPEPDAPELESDEPFDPRKIVRPEEGDPGLPQLNRAPVFKKPRF